MNPKQYQFVLNYNLKQRPSEFIHNYHLEQNNIMQ